MVQGLKRDRYVFGFNFYLPLFYFFSGNEKVSNENSFDFIQRKFGNVIPPLAVLWRH